MNKKSTKEIFYTWKNFLEEERSINSSLLNENIRNNSKSNKRKVQQLIEWGDSLEYLINENIDIKLLESHYLNESLIGKWKKLKDKVKSFFTQGFTKDKKDAEGNVVRVDPNSEESLAVKEYTSLTKAIYSGLVIAMLTTTFFGAAGITPEATNDHIPKIISVSDNSNMDQQTANSLSELATDQPEEAKKLVDELENEESDLPSVQYINMASMDIIGTIKNLKGDKGLESLLKKIKPRPEALGTKDDALKFELGLTKRVLELAAKESGIDTDGSYDYSEYSSEVTQDLSKANNAVKNYISQVDLSTFVNTAPEMRQQFDQFDLKEYKEKLASLDEKSVGKLIEAARVYTIKKSV